MHRPLARTIVIFLLSVGLWGSGSKESWGQTCPVNQGCNNILANTADYATLSGGRINIIGPNADRATVGGGESNNATRQYATVGGGYDNAATGVSTTVGGGYKNTASAQEATVSGGIFNEASGIDATVGGGYENTAAGNATVGGGVFNEASGLDATVGGGGVNTADGAYSVVSGGFRNTAQGSRATVSGGVANFALGFAAAIPGGYSNRAGGNFSFAAGRQAQAKHAGAFVWADATAADFVSTTLNQFNVRASGGTRIFSNAAATVGVQLAPGSNAWSIASDRALKEDFQPIDKQQVLANLQHLTIQNWKLKDEAGNVRHIGPVAQDFHAAFQLGSDERFIHTGDAVGVSLVAIQALTEQNQTLTKRVDILQQENAGLRKQLRQVVQQVQAFMQESQSNHRREVARAE